MLEHTIILQIRQDKLTSSLVMKVTTGLVILSNIPCTKVPVSHVTITVICCDITITRSVCMYVQSVSRSV